MHRGSSRFTNGFTPGRDRRLDDDHDGPVAFPTGHHACATPNVPVRRDCRSRWGCLAVSSCLCMSRSPNLRQCVQGRPACGVLRRFRTPKKRSTCLWGWHTRTRRLGRPPATRELDLWEGHRPGGVAKGPHLRWHDRLRSAPHAYTVAFQANRDVTMCFGVFDCRVTIRYGPLRPLKLPEIVPAESRWSTSGGTEGTCHPPLHGVLSFRR
jgi:hypothetical protein